MDVGSRCQTKDWNGPVMGKICTTSWWEEKNTPKVLWLRLVRAFEHGSLRAHALRVPLAGGRTCTTGKHMHHQKVGRNTKNTHGPAAVGFVRLTIGHHHPRKGLDDLGTQPSEKHQKHTRSCGSGWLERSTDNRKVPSSNLGRTKSFPSVKAIDRCIRRDKQDP